MATSQSNPQLTSAPGNGVRTALRSQHRAETLPSDEVNRDGSSALTGQLARKATARPNTKLRLRNALERVLAEFGEGGAARGHSKLEYVNVRVPRAYLEVLQELADLQLESYVAGRAKNHVPLFYVDKGSIAPWFVAVSDTLKRLNADLRRDASAARKRRDASLLQQEGSSAVYTFDTNTAVPRRSHDNRTIHVTRELYESE